ncbi:hypothetical protein QTJ16_004936 [Diplocarpon rosae]|uniref:Kinetochore protein n=1 Tax=Diplocarpon rosae TaxID=946125 RepID=A0AAD9WE51_9HELO|nr:hypothetical protein QTJ16_004936 [Diplocarpon rosae]
MSPPTILERKTAFLRAQILALAQPLRPSPAFAASNASAGEDALRQRAIDEALCQLNSRLKRHVRLAYGPQAQRHVAEQIDTLYWNAGERGGRLGDEWAERGSDYREPSIIEQLPEEWSEEASATAPEQAAKYAELQQRLTALDAQRRVAREKVERYQRMRELVGLLGEDAGLQENLVTKNGELELELEEMRRLMLRVERGVGALEQRESEDEMDMDGGMEEDGKITALLSSAFS